MFIHRFIPCFSECVSYRELQFVQFPLNVTLCSVQRRDVQEHLVNSAVHLQKTEENSRKKRVCYEGLSACERSAESLTLRVHPAASTTLTQRRPVSAAPERLVGHFSFSISVFLSIVT